MPAIAPPLRFLAYWTHDLSPFLLRFGEEGFGIRYYGLAYLLGFGVAAWLLYFYARRSDRSALPPALVADFMTALVVGVMVGGRLGYFLLYQPELLFSEPVALLRVWEGGMASHGGFVGVVLATWWFARRHGIAFLHLGDLVASVAAAGLFFGRVANFINGELWGKPSAVAWAVLFPESPLPLVPRHPSQLYAAALEGLVLLAFAQWRFWRSERVKTTPGRLGGEFLVAYALLRIVGEVFREPDASLILGLSRGTFYSLLTAAAGLGLIGFCHKTPLHKKS
ncbi:prolipoprotein diacylglyceryl transferase [Cephaloticoccus capnophilus]|uniref:Phosphatidylglycerol--prolipoprotein diacylglyceryl transferase n=1 Tax=Cephaloticoccus capnophilus TaxID=1548208 RepID=A0A139SJZ1_9BACT|nr:prolipoprotein diacylglyceryl transferase [Cephaloticoccus capnophilus]